MKDNRRKAWRSRVWAALIVMLAMCLPGLAGVTAAVMAEALPAAEEGLAAPYVEPDDTLSTGQRTWWDCVYFGTYPQTEIVASPSDAVDDYAVQEGDFLVDPALYARLSEAGWSDNETELDGERYLRMMQADAVTSAANRDGHYRWNAETKWHYFRFDPLRWRVLAVEDEKAFLLADRMPDCEPYHSEDGPITWERSTLRSWLNCLPGEENDAGIDYRGKGFLDRAFTAEEREAVLLTQVENRDNACYGTDCGNDTEDAVFLLSNDEVFGTEIAARNGFYPFDGKDDPAKRFCSTMYAKCRGAWWSAVEGYKGNSFWFMRTNGYTRESVTYICDFGYIYQRGTISSCEDAGVLPALWVSLDRAVLEEAGTVSSGDVQQETGTAAEDRDGRTRVRNPMVTEAPELPDGKQVTYSMIRFGTYPQTEVTEDETLMASLRQADWEGNETEYEGTGYVLVRDEAGKERVFAREPLLWRVLEAENGTALLLSHAAVDCAPFQEDLADVSWAECTLRSYLNGYGPARNVSGRDYTATGENFLARAFTAEEQEAILEMPVRNEDNYYFGTDSGEMTHDRIFLLAESELFVYDSAVIHGFSPRDEIPDRAKQFTPTDWALRKGVWCGEAGNVFWITRTPGYTPANVVYVDESGYMYNRGILVTCRDAALIPALVLDLDSAVYEYAGTYTVGED